MKRLTAKALHGVWAGVTMSWDVKCRFDTADYARNIEDMCQAGVHGVYTTGSTGEFYAIEFNEFTEMVDIQADICGRRSMPLQIGCNADSTAKSIRLLEYAASKPQVGAAQVVVPYWMELTDRELLQFFKDLYSACPNLPLVHYNVPRAKRFLNGADYQRIKAVAPSLVGVKYTMAGSHFGELQSALLMNPDLSFFVAETFLASAMMLGARGTYSSLICTNPAFMLRFYDEAAHGRWKKAIAMQQEAERFYDDMGAFVAGLGEGTMDPVFDKGLARAAGCLAGSQRIRPPYIGWSDATVAAVRRRLKTRWPQFLHPSLAREIPGGKRNQGR